MGKVYSRLAMSGNERWFEPQASMGDDGGVAGPGAARVGVGTVLRLGRGRGVVDGELGVEEMRRWRRGRGLMSWD